MADHEPMMDGGCADPALSPELRDALTLLREHSDDSEFRTLVDDVLAGRCSLVEASGTAAFSNVVFASIAQEFDQLTAEEKERLAAQAESTGHGPCGLPCSSCAGACALRGSPSQ
ncbi:MAG: hypothetical protein ACRDQU_21425 [Pseudonocardiaceae bacterium]